MPHRHRPEARCTIVRRTILTWYLTRSVCEFKGEPKILATEQGHRISVLIFPLRHVCAYMKSQLRRPKSPADRPQSSAPSGARLPLSCVGEGRRERLPGGLGRAQLAAGGTCGSNQGGGIVRNMCETCGEGGEFSRRKSIFYLTALPRNLSRMLAFCAWPLGRVGIHNRTVVSISECPFPCFSSILSKHNRGCCYERALPPEKQCDEAVGDFRMDYRSPRLVFPSILPGVQPHYSWAFAKVMAIAQGLLTLIALCGFCLGFACFGNTILRLLRFGASGWRAMLSMFW